MRNSRSRPRGSVRFRVTARLLAFSIATGRVVFLPPDRARRRSGSPVSGSILMTLAPALAISIEQYGPW